MPHLASDPFWQSPRSKQAVLAAVTIDPGAISAGVFVFTGYYLGAKVGLNKQRRGRRRWGSRSHGNRRSTQKRDGQKKLTRRHNFESGTTSTPNNNSVRNSS